MESMSDLSVNVLENVSLEDIVLMVRDARLKNAELNFLHHLIQSRRSKAMIPRIVERSSILFREIMSASYAALDQSFYFLYCHLQNGNQPSFGDKAFRIKTPVKQTLRWSSINNADSVHCRNGREEFLKDQCESIFGDNYANRIRSDKLKHFKFGVLSLQVLSEVDNAGNILKTCTKHDPCHQQDCEFEGPKLVYFKDLNSTEKLTSASKGDREEWSDSMTFNLLHFFRNFTSHRALIACRAKYVGLTLNDLAWKVSIYKGLWIHVPELSHLRDKERKTPPKFYWYPVLTVCDRILNFVESYLNNLFNSPNSPYSPNEYIEFRSFSLLESARDWQTIDVKKGDKVIDRYTFKKKNDRWFIEPAI